MSHCGHFDCMRADRDMIEQVNTREELQAYFDELQGSLAEVETEDTWQRLDKALAKLEQITKGGGYKLDNFVPLIKDKLISRPIINSLLSERTRISGTAADLLNSVAPRLAERFEPLVPVFVPSLLTICARTNKVAYKRAQKTLALICTYCHVPWALLPLLREAAKDKVGGLRVVAVECAVVLLQNCDRDRISRRSGAENIEEIIRVTARDASNEVRTWTKQLFGIYETSLTERVEK